MDDAKLGEHFGGSGFLVSVHLEQNPLWWNGYVVTNWHVIRRADCAVIRLNGSVEFIETSPNEWFRHPDGDDIAVIPVDLQYEHLRFWSIDIKYFVTPQLIFEEDIGIGDDTIMVGRFVSHEGQQRNSPAARFGNIAMMAGEKIQTKERDQEAFLVEVRSLPGYSGSPVFIYSPCAMNDMSERRGGRKKGEYLPGQNPSIRKEGQVTVTNFDLGDLYWTHPKGPFLLGIDFCHLNRREMVREQNGDKVRQGWYVEENTGMAGVIPAWKIAEVLNGEALKKMRENDDREVTERVARAGVSLDADFPERMQTTKEGVDIPVPSKEDFESALKKASRKK